MFDATYSTDATAITSAAMEAKMASTTPNIDKLEAVFRSLGEASISFQNRGEGSGSFFTVTRNVNGASRYCSIGQGDTLAEAFLAEAADLKAITAKVSIAAVEKAAA